MEQSKELERAATEQLCGVAQKWFEGSIAYEIVARTRDLAAGIVEAERQLGVDAVTMAIQAGQEQTIRR